MTENEAIEKILCMGVGRSGLENESSIIAKALSELMEYRTIGTVEEVKNAYGRGYNQGGIDRTEELQKCREYGYNKAIDKFFNELCKASESVRPVGWTGRHNVVLIERAMEIAEQMKAGDEDDREGNF